MSNIHPLYFLWENKLVIFTAFMAAATAAVATSPIPDSVWALWLYDWAHQLLNIKNTRLAKETIPTPPDDHKESQ